jgi:hypothetical protein
MPETTVNAGQIIGKTLFLKKSANFYRAADIQTPTRRNLLAINYLQDIFL